MFNYDLSTPIILPQFDPAIFSIGFISVRYYSLAYVIGILATYFFIKKINQKENFLSKNALENFVPYVIFSVLIGGRLGYVLFYNFDYYSQNLTQIFAFWRGGMSFHGGLIGVIIGMIIFAKKYKINFLQLTDKIVITAPIGIFLGRIANFINLELYGRTTDSKFGMIFPNAGDLPRHASQLYEAMLEGLLTFLILASLFRFTKIAKYRGCSSGLFLLFYGSFRIALENFREPDEQIGFLLASITMGQALSIPLIISGMILIYFSFRKNHKINPHLLQKNAKNY